MTTTDALPQNSLSTTCHKKSPQGQVKWHEWSDVYTLPFLLEFNVSIFQAKGTHNCALF